MAEYEPSTYGDRWADLLDEWVARQGHVADPDVIADRLAELAGSGPALELAIGTGRVALPLAARGVEVHGIDASESMVARLRAKPGGDAIPFVIGDMADVGVDGVYSLVYVVFNTLFALLTQDDQVRCFRNVAAHLAEGGAFAMEAFVFDAGYYDRGQSLRTSELGSDLVGLTASMHDPVEQRIRAMIVMIDGVGTRLLPVQLRYAWPSELDLMARLAGLRLRERWGGWNREPFTAASGAHVSLCERAAPAGS
jgi:SAM-dependent methyltransferase